MVCYLVKGVVSIIHCISNNFAHLHWHQEVSTSLR